MQIHELTRRAIKEGIGSELAGMAANAMGMGPAQTATKAAAGLTKQGYGPGYQPPSANWEDKYNKVVQDPAVKQYVAGLAKAWVASQQTPVKEADVPAVSAPANPGLPTPAEQEKFQQKVAAAAGKTAPTDKTTAAKPTAPAALPNDYLSKFLAFTDAKLASKIPGTYETVTMDQVRKLPGIQSALDKKLANVKATAGTPQNAYNVEEYLKVAVAGIQAVSQQIKNKAGAGAGAAPGANATTLGLSPQQIRSLRSMAQDPNGQAEIKQLLGLR